MKKLVFIVVLILLNSMVLKAQKVDTMENPMNNLNFMLGEWEGTGWMMTREGKEESDMREKVECKQGCNIMIVEGLGTKTDPDTKELKISHEAFGVITYNFDTKSYQLRAYKDGNVTVSDIEMISDNKIRWNMDVPNNGKVRFTAEYTDSTWQEIGEFSRDGGESWMQFLGMDLMRIKK